jgi:hypothetical protein
MTKSKAPSLVYGEGALGLTSFRGDSEGWLGESLVPDFAALRTAGGFMRGPGRGARFNRKINYAPSWACVMAIVAPGGYARLRLL